MNAEYLLDAIGLLDDDLIQDAERYYRRKSRPHYRQWLAWAACFAVVIVLGYGVTHLRMGGGNSSAPNTASGGAASSTCQQAPIESNNGGEPSTPAGSEDLESPSVPEPSSSIEGDWCAAIMVDGVLYWSTDTPIPVEVDESVIRTVTSYTDAQPEVDGQTNFSQDLSAQYAWIELGQNRELVVRMDAEWVLFDPVPPWER